MRHLQISTRPQLRGAEVFAAQLAKELRRRGHDARNLFLYRSDDEVQLETTAPDWLLAFDADDRRERWLGFQPRLLRRLRDIVRDFAPEVVQLNGSRAVKYGALLRWCGWRDGLLIYRSIGDPAAWAGPAWRRLLYAKLVVSRMSGIVAVSRNTEQSLRRCYAPQVPIAVIPRGIDMEALRVAVPRPRTRQALGIAERATVALSVGRLSAEKRPVWLIETLAPLLAEVESLVLVLVGDGPVGQEAAKVVRAHGLETRVLLLGTRGDVGDLIAATDLLLLASSTEGSPGVILEAGALGLPVVATNVGGVTDLVEPEQTGLVVAVDDRDGFRNAVRALLDPGRRQTLGDAAFRRVVDHFSIASIADQSLQFYHRIRGA
ncbi:MAG: glycosyltransferase family 1 protein [Acidobacteria bacterium]|nr:MAG: glycosyltransferase family 1 protein [Acidobacteriota bacterium]REK04377.1 MAG: glycosyltransferase family 1 protein [Acidobacteriota bacterium]